jgi:hypothetical protein
MAARIEWKDIDKALREPLAAAISDAIGQREGEDWIVRVSRPDDVDAWDIAIHGPDEFAWTHRFEGAERVPALVGNSVRVAIEMSTGDLSIALAELVRQGITFTTERRPDGQTNYTIDRVTLKDEEVMQLAKQGALTRDGIRSYLVNR